MIDTSEKIRNRSRLTLFLYASRHFLLPDPLFPPVVAKLNPNIRAGVKKLKTLMTLAAYNAGPARIKQCRQMATRMGLNPISGSKTWIAPWRKRSALKPSATSAIFISSTLAWNPMSDREAVGADVKMVHVQAKRKQS